MILQGILVQSLNQYCIRGVARLADLEKISAIDKGYQRNLIEKWRAEMEVFLEDPEMFFPEVLLSYHLKEAGNPFEVLQAGRRLGSTTDPIRFHVKKVPVKINGVVQPTAYYVTIEIDEGRLVAEDGVTSIYPFFRIDGNHRLSAAANLDSNSNIANLNTPFCLLLLLSNTPSLDDTSRQFERTVFHNVNSKSVPLTHEEILKVVVDLSSGISDERLKEKFSPAHLYARKQYGALHTVRYPAIQSLFRPVSSSEPGHERQLFWQLHQLLYNYAEITADADNNSATDDALRKVELLYSTHTRLNRSKSLGLLLAFLFYAFRANERGGQFRLEYFTKWILQNYFSEIETIEAESLIMIFDKVFTNKSRQVFVSMPFAPALSPHYDAFEMVIKEINREISTDIPLTIKRVDLEIKGISYQIPIEILEQIRSAGLLIADLTSTNANVYHEIGYLMGLTAHDPLQPSNMIFVCNTTKTQVPTEVGFNLRNYKIITFEDAVRLMPILKKEIMAYYYPEAASIVGR